MERFNQNLGISPLDSPVAVRPVTAGIDEAGRGALVGLVIAAAVILLLDKPHTL